MIVAGLLALSLVAALVYAWRTYISSNDPWILPDFVEFWHQGDGYGIAVISGPFLDRRMRTLQTETLEGPWLYKGGVVTEAMQQSCDDYVLEWQSFSLETENDF